MVILPGVRILFVSGFVSFFGIVLITLKSKNPDMKRTLIVIASLAIITLCIFGLVDGVDLDLVASQAVEFKARLIPA